MGKSKEHIDVKEKARLKKIGFQKGHPGGMHTQKHPEGYLTSIIKRYLEKQLAIIDPVTKKKVKGLAKTLIIQRLLRNAAGGDNVAIKEILDRAEGKIKDKTEHSVDDTTQGALLKALEKLDGHGF